MRPTLKAFALGELQTERPSGVEAEVVFVQRGVSAAFEAALLKATKSRLSALPRHVTLCCARGEWDAVCDLGIQFGTKGTGYLARVHNALHAFAAAHPGETLCLWLDEAHALSASGRETLCHLILHVCAQLDLSARLCLVLREKELKAFDGQQWRKVWRFPTEGRRLPQIARCWNACSRGMAEAAWDTAEAEAEADETYAARKIG